MVSGEFTPPRGADEGLLEEIMREIHGSAERLGGVAIVGGHTEVTPGLKKPIVVGTMLGEVEKGGKLVTSNGGAKAGDSIILTKWAGLEGGTSIIASERGGKSWRRPSDGPLWRGPPPSSG